MNRQRQRRKADAAFLGASEIGATRHPRPPIALECVQVLGQTAPFRPPPRPNRGGTLQSRSAGRYTLAEAGQVEVAPDGGFERGARRVMGEPSGEVEWNSPRRGYRALFKFG
ncbi:MAG TPA: hypothetical protein VEF36_05675 [Roseiarcus sp.]|nr:hypothetical protein [Roseiarcus sp.]